MFALLDFLRNGRYLMKKLLMVFVAFSVLFFAALANAGTWMSGMSVRGVQSLADGGFIIYGPPNAAPQCPEGGKLFYVRNGENGQTSEGVKSALSIVLVAFVSGKTITFAYDESSSNCYVNTILVNP